MKYMYNNISTKYPSCLMKCISFKLPTHVFYIRLTHSRHGIYLNKYSYLESNGLRPYDYRSTCNNNYFYLLWYCFTSITNLNRHFVHCKKTIICVFSLMLTLSYFHFSYVSFLKFQLN